ncbi:MAG: DUF533 domain-containing protein [Pseudomonadota bacterium]
MSLMRTLAKVAVGVAVAKGASALMKNRGAAAGAATGGGGLGGLLGGLQGGGAAAGGANLQGMLGGLLGGAGGGGGGLGGLLEGLGGAGGAQGGGLQSMLGGLAGGAGAAGLMGALGGRAAERPADNGSSFGAVLNSQFAETPEPAIEPTADQEALAALMLRAMIQAAKCDGTLDAEEEEKLVGQLGGDVDAEEAAFVRAEMQRPVDVDGLVAEVPQGMGPQVYAMSVLAINLDSQAEAQYLHSLAQGLGMGTDEVNHVHAQLGVPSLYQ